MSSSNGVPVESLILSFPEEILDQICEEMARTEKGSTATLGAWICTCRTFVSSGERVLYRSPFRSFPSQFYLSHTAFLRTLQARPDLAAQLFRAGESPMYPTAMKTIIACYCLFIASMFIYQELCRRENRRRDRLAAEGVEEAKPRLASGEDNLSDRKDLGFRYIL